MMADRFEALLQELGTYRHLSLHRDAQGQCCLRMPGDMTVMIMQREQQVIVFVAIGSVGEGKFREALFREALQLNGMPQARPGIFCYNIKKELLGVYEALPFDDTTGGQLSTLIDALVEVAQQWKDSISRGEVPTAPIATSHPLPFFL